MMLTDPLFYKLLHVGLGMAGPHAACGPALGASRRSPDSTPTGDATAPAL